MKMKKLLAAALAATMVVSSMVSSFVASAATLTGTITAGSVEVTAGATEVTVPVTIAFTNEGGVESPHGMFTVKIADASLTKVELVSPIINAKDANGDDVLVDGQPVRLLNVESDGVNLTTGTVIVESATDSKAPTVTEEIVVNCTFTIPAAQAGTIAVDISDIQATNLSEDDWTGMTAVSGSIVVAEAHVCAPGAYTDNGDGTHDIACSGCDQLYADNEAHTYVDGTCVCGATEAVECEHADATYEYSVDGTNCITTKVCECGYEEVVSSLVNLKFSHAPVYESDLTLIFRMQAADTSKFAAYSDVHAVFTKDMYDTAGELTDPQVNTIFATTQDGSGRVQFVYNGIRSIDMSSNINCKIFGTDANGVVVLIATEDYSFKTYIMQAYNAYKSATTGTKNAAECKLVADIAYYGAAAQNHFTYNTNNLPNADIPESATTPQFALSDFNFDGTLIQSGVSFGRAPDYKDKILLNIRFVKTAVSEGSYLKVDYKYVDGSDLQDVTNFADFVQDPTNADRYQVVFDKLCAACIPTEFTITLCDVDGNELGSCVYGMEIYAYQATNASSIKASEKTLVNEMVAYGRSADAYFNFGK